MGKRTALCLEIDLLWVFFVCEDFRGKFMCFDNIYFSYSFREITFLLKKKKSVSVCR